jgi:ABC-2 type transport system permease protein
MRILTVALREFKATAFTKAFFFGVVVVPVLITLLVPVAMYLINVKPPPVVGSVAVIDHTGKVAPLLEERLTPEGIADRLRKSAQAVTDASAKLAENNLEGKTGEAVGNQLRANSERVSDAATANAPNLTMEALDPATPDADAKAPLMDGDVKAGGRLVLVVIKPHAVEPKPADPNADPAATPTPTYESFDLFIRPKLDTRVHGMVASIVRDAIIDARLANANEDRARLTALMRVQEPQARAVTPEGERSSGELQQMILPLAFMLLLWISVMTGGQYLLASTIEEKSNRVMEVLLSAVSPIQLMTGKILGQMAAALLVLLIYSGAGLVALIALSAMYLIDPMSLVFLGVFFFIAFFCVASLMAAVGSAVTDIHEAQTLLTPVMLVIITPMFLMMPIVWNPDSTLARVLSFTPPVSPFVMVLRISSSSPPPLWETLAAMALGLVTAYLMLRFAAKVFRVGVLMYGKPPSFATLIKWIRMA